MSKRIAFLTASEGVEEVELTKPWQAAVDAGHTAELLSTRRGRGAAVRAPRQVQHPAGRPPRVRRRRRRLRRPRPARRRRQPRRPAHGRGGRRVHPRLRRLRQARRGDLPRPLDPRRGRPRARASASPAGRACRPTSATAAASGWTRRSSSTATSSPAATPTTSRPSTRPCSTPSADHRAGAHSTSQRPSSVPSCSSSRAGRSATSTVGARGDADGVAAGQPRHDRPAQLVDDAGRQQVGEQRRPALAQLLGPTTLGQRGLERDEVDLAPRRGRARCPRPASRAPPPARRRSRPSPSASARAVRRASVGGRSADRLTTTSGTRGTSYSSSRSVPAPTTRQCARRRAGCRRPACRRRC